MYALVIGASSESVYAINRARSYGMKVLAFDGDKGAEGLKYADESFVVDIRDPEKIYSIIDRKRIHPEEMVVLPVPIGRYLISAGSLNDHYNLIGVRKETADICTDKWLFHQKLHHAGLRDINCNLITAGKTEKINPQFPGIIKPRYGAGSRSVQMLSNAGEWKKFADMMPFEEDFVMEDLVSGTEYGIDGMVLNGKFMFILARKKIITPPPYRQCVGYLSVNVNDENSILLSRLSGFMCKLVKTIKMNNGILHADIIDDGEKTFVIEMSARPSGHRLHDEFTPLVTGVDMISEFLKFVISGENHVSANTPDQVFLIRYFDMESDIVKIPEREEMIKKYSLIKYECNLKPGCMDKVKDDHSLMKRGFFIVKGDSESSVCKTAGSLLKEYI